MGIAVWIMAEGPGDGGNIQIPPHSVEADSWIPNADVSWEDRTKWLLGCETRVLRNVIEKVVRHCGHRR